MTCLSAHPAERIAVSRLHLADGRVLYNQVIEIAGGRLVRHYPLVEELPFCKWFGGDCHVDAAGKVSNIVSDV